MDRNTTIGLILIGLILLASSYFLEEQPPQEKPKGKKQTDEQVQKEREQQEKPTKTPDQKEQPKRESQKPETTAEQQQADGQEKAAEADTSGKVDLGVFTPFTAGEQEEITLENEVMELRLSTKGGNVKYVRLKDYQQYDSTNLVLIDESSSKFSYHFFHKNQSINTSDLYFKPKGPKQVSVTGKDSQTVRMVLPIADNKYLEQIYTITGDSYIIDYDLRLIGFNEVIPINTDYIDLTWASKLQQQEMNVSNERNKSGINFKYKNGDVDYLSHTGSSKQDIASSLKWVAFKQQFFSQILIADQEFDRGTVEQVQQEDLPFLERHSSDITIPFNHNGKEEFGMKMFFGPNKYQELNSHGHELTELLPLGWAIFKWVNTFIIIPTFNFLGNFIASYGLIIICLTVIIKVLLTPLTYKSFMSQAKMRALKPEIDKLKEKHGNDMQKMQMEQMKLYRKAGINPVGGCFPMLLQMPFLIAMFRFFPSSIELRQESFLWAHDLSTYDSIWQFPGNFSIPFYGDHISLFALLMALSTMLYSWYSQKLNPTTNDQMATQMKMMIYIMPIMILFIFNNYASGLACYYFFYNVLSFGQQFMFQSLVNEDKIRQQIEERKKKPDKKSKFQQRLEEMAKQQQEVKKK